MKTKNYTQSTIPLTNPLNNICNHIDMIDNIGFTK